MDEVENTDEKLGLQPFFLFLVSSSNKEMVSINTCLTLRMKTFYFVTVAAEEPPFFPPKLSLMKMSES